jgi:antitoxin (DNA-binding transcriptional repressor) of toxin-antitoxin stability system
MRSMTDADASENFYAMLDAVQQGEEIVLIRGGVAVARLIPERANIAAQLEEVMNRFPVDPGWADDLEAVVRDLRVETDQERTWPAE